VTASGRNPTRAGTYSTSMTAKTWRRSTARRAAPPYVSCGNARRSRLRLVVDAAAVIDAEDVDGKLRRCVPQSDMCAAPGAVTADQRAEQWRAGTLRTDGERDHTELKDRGDDGSGRPTAGMARRAAVWKPVVYHSPSGTASDTAPGQVLANGRQARARLASAERGQALGDDQPAVPGAPPSRSRSPPCTSLPDGTYHVQRAAGAAAKRNDRSAPLCGCVPMNGPGERLAERPSARVCQQDGIPHPTCR
jgi:hypothetical protein